MPKAPPTSAPPSSRSASPAKTPVQPGIQTLYDSPGHLVRRLHQRVNALFTDDMVDAPDVTATQFAILSTIELAPNSEQSEIAKLAHLDVATTSGVTNRLEAMGLVTRTKSTRSRNGWCVSLSEAGQAVMTRSSMARQKLPERLFYMLTSSERHEFLRLLSMVAEVENSYTRGSASGVLDKTIPKSK